VSAVTLTRRKLLKTGAGGSLLLALSGCAPPTDHRTMLRAIARAMLAGALPSNNVETALDAAVRGVETAIAGLPPAVQDDVHQLFSLLEFPLTRRFVAGVGPWERASTSDVDAFLERWRTSNAQLMRSGYQALHQLVMAGWYGQDAAWARIGYSGPPTIA
jgi:hypothetical protein